MVDPPTPYSRDVITCNGALNLSTLIVKSEAWFFGYLAVGRARERALRQQPPQ